MENLMTRLKLLTATAVLTSVIATPVMAQQRTTTYRADPAYEHRDDGFWPGQVAAGIVGGAIGTAGAIATAPFRGDSYAYYDDGYNSGYNNGYRRHYDSYAALNGFVCQPGTWFRGEDGRRHICQ